MNQYILENPVAGTVLGLAQKLGTNVQELLDSYFQSSYELRSEIVAAQTRADGTILISARSASLGEVEAAIRTIAGRYGIATYLPGGTFLASFLEISADGIVSGAEEVNQAARKVGSVALNSVETLVDWKTILVMVTIYWLIARK